MAVNWRDGDCAARNEAYEAACRGGEFNWQVEEWDEYTDLREALIWALILVKFPANSRWKISEKNWKEIFTRLHILESTLGCYRLLEKGKELYFQTSEVHSMIGFEVNAGNQSDAEFRKLIMYRLKENATNHLNRYVKELEDSNERTSKG